MKGLLAFGFLAVVANAHAIMIDDFMTGSYNSGAISAGTVNAWTSASVSGGVRFQSLSVISNPLGGDAKCRVITSPGVLDVSTDSDVDINYTLGYGFAASSTTVGSNPLNANFSTIPILDLVFRTNDQNLPVVVTLYTNGGANSFSRSVNVSSGIFSTLPASYQFDFTSDAANLGDVDAIKIDFDPAAGGDFSLTSVQAVPEPAAIATLSLGALALLRRRKK